MSLETGFDHNHFGEKDIIVLFWLFHSNIECFRVFKAFFFAERLQNTTRYLLNKEWSLFWKSVKIHYLWTSLKVRFVLEKNFESCHCSILTFFNSFRHSKLMSRNICYCDQRENLIKLHLWQKKIIFAKNCYFSKKNLKFTKQWPTIDQK